MYLATKTGFIKLNFAAIIVRYPCIAMYTTATMPPGDVEIHNRIIHRRILSYAHIMANVCIVTNIHYTAKLYPEATPYTCLRAY